MPMDDEEFKIKLGSEEGLSMLRDAVGKLKESNPELAGHLMDELKETITEGSNVVLVGTDGDVSITIVHTPREALNGEDGPVIFPSVTRNKILAAVSREMLDQEVKKAESLEDGSLGDVYWDGFMNDLMNQVRELYKKNPRVI